MTSRADSQIAFEHVSAVMQEIVVKVFRGDIEVGTFRFCNPPKQAALIKEALEELGHKGVLQDGTYIYTSGDLLQRGAYTLKVSEAAAGKSTTGHHVWSGLPLPERLSPVSEVRRHPFGADQAGVR